MELTPAFSPDVTSYTADYRPQEVGEELTVSATPAIEGSINKIRMSNPVDMSPVYTEIENGGTVVLYSAYSENPVMFKNIEVLLKSGSERKTYTVQIHVIPTPQ